VLLYGDGLQLLLLHPCCWLDLSHVTSLAIETLMPVHRTLTGAGLRQLARLELLSYEDVSDAELAPLTDCPRLTHLYVDSLFIKQVSLVQELGDVVAGEHQCGSA
jgi:hypothetical protein